MGRITKEDLMHMAGIEKSMQGVHEKESLEASDEDRDFKYMSSSSKANRCSSRAAILDFIIENSIPVNHSKVQGCVEVNLKRPGKKDQTAIIALKGKVQFDGKGKWYPYSQNSLKDLLKYAV